MVERKYIEFHMTKQIFYDFYKQYPVFFLYQYIQLPNVRSNLLECTESVIKLYIYTGCTLILLKRPTRIIWIS